MNTQETQTYYQNHATARWSTLIAICLGSFLLTISLSATLVAIPAIAESLHADAVYVSWIPAAFLLSNLIALLPAGRLSDIHGRKRIYILGSTLFILASFLAGFATNIVVLLIARTLQGIGAAMSFSSGMAIVSSVFQNKGRGAALGWVIAAVYFGLTCGPLLGGWINDHYGWQWVFFFPLILAILTLLLTLSQVKGEWKQPNPQPLDKLGTLWLMLGLSALFLGLTHLTSLIGLLELGTGIVFLWLFQQQTQRSSAPLIRLKLVWENRVLSHSLLAAIGMYSASYGLMFLLGLYLQYNRGMTATQAGQMLMIQAFTMAALAPFAGRLSDRYPPKLLATLGALAISLSCALLLLINSTTPLILIGSALFFQGVAFGLFSTPNTNAAMGSVAETQLGIASALLNMSRLTGQVFGSSLVTLLMALYIGNSKILPDHYGNLLSVLHWVILSSLLFGLVAAYLSATGLRSALARHAAQRLG